MYRRRFASAFGAGSVATTLRPRARYRAAQLAPITPVPTIAMFRISRFFAILILQKFGPRGVLCFLGLLLGSHDRFNACAYCRLLDCGVQLRDRAASTQTADLVVSKTEFFQDFII